MRRRLSIGWVAAAAGTASVLAGCNGGDVERSVHRSDTGEDGGDAPATVRTDWWLAEPVQGDRLSVVVYTGSSECVTFERLAVDETLDVVTIEAFVDVASTTDCTDDYTIHAEDVTLSDALGDRGLVGCVAPGSGLRAWDLEPLPQGTDCSARVRTELTVP